MGKLHWYDLATDEALCRIWPLTRRFADEAADVTCKSCLKRLAR